MLKGKPYNQVLVHQEGLPIKDASSEHFKQFQQDFPSINLEDKVVFQVIGNDMNSSNRIRVDKNFWPETLCLG